MKRYILLLVLTSIVFALTPTERCVKHLNNTDESTLFNYKIILPEEIVIPETGTRTEKISSMRVQAEKYQKYIVDNLELLVKNGEVSSYRQLWIVNAVTFKGTKEALEHLINNQTGVIDTDFPMPALLRDPHDSSHELTELEYGDSLAWGVNKIRANKVWNDFGYTGNNVLLAVMDTGIQPNHPDLVDNLWVNDGEIPHNGIDDDENGYIDDFHGYNTAYGNGDTYDDRGHGTHVAGTVCGNGSLGMGCGVAPRAKVMAIKTIDSEGNGIISDSWEGFEYALLMNVKAVNLSIGWTYSDSDLDRGLWRSVIENARELGLLAVVSAGNEGGDAMSTTDLRCPGDVPASFTIGATVFSDLHATFSSVGPVTWQDISPYFDHPYPPGLCKPDISAPGEDIPSCELVGTYVEKNGTSMAAPHVTGAVGVLLEIDSTLTPDQIINILQSNVDEPVDTGLMCLYYGAGRLDLYKAVQSMIPSGYIQISTEPSTEFQFSNGTIAYSDSFGILNLTGINGDSLTFEAFCTGFSSETGDIVFASDTNSYSMALIPLDTLEIKLIVQDFNNLEPIGSSLVLRNGLSDTLLTDEHGKISIFVYNGSINDLFITNENYSFVNLNFSTHSDTLLHIFLEPCWNFESTDHDFIYSVDWEWGVPVYSEGPSVAHSGLSLMGTKLDTTYTDSTLSILKSPEFTITNDKASIKFFHWYQIEASNRGLWDGGNVKVSTDHGENWEIVYPDGCYPGHIDDYNDHMPFEPAFSGLLWGLSWQPVRFDLSRYYEDTLMVGFFFSSDDNTNYSGWYIDDFLLENRSPKQPFLNHLRTDYIDEALYIDAESYGITAPISEVNIHAVLKYPPDNTILVDWRTYELLNETAIFDSFACVIDSLPEWFIVEYYLTSTDTDSLIARYPETGYLSDTFGVEDIPPVIEVLNHRDKTLSREQYLIRAIARDENGVDSDMMKIHYSGEIEIDSVMVSTFYGDTALFIVPLELEVGDSFTFYVTAEDSTSRRNRGFSDTLTINICNRIDFDFANAGDLFYADSFWFYGDLDIITPPGDGHIWYNPDAYSLTAGIHSMVMPFVSLMGVTNASMFVLVYRDLPAGGGVNFTDGENLINTMFGYDSYNTWLTDSVFSGTSAYWDTIYFDLSPYLDDRFDLNINLASDGGPGIAAIGGLTLLAFDMVIDEIDKPDILGMKIFPNPGNSVFNIETSSLCTINIYDINGKVLHSGHSLGGLYSYTPDLSSSSVLIVESVYSTGMKKYGYMVDIK